LLQRLVHFTTRYLLFTNGGQDLLLLGAEFFRLLIAGRLRAASATEAEVTGEDHGKHDQNNPPTVLSAFLKLVAPPYERHAFLLVNGRTDRFHDTVPRFQCQLSR